MWALRIAGNGTTKVSERIINDMSLKFTSSPTVNMALDIRAPLPHFIAHSEYGLGYSRLSTSIHWLCQ